PYDQGINQAFVDGIAERRKSQQPFVVVLRSQFGKYIGCTLNYPPGNLNIPPFPAPPPPVVVVPPRPVVVAPPAPVPDLVIVGTHVGTNLNAPPPPVANASISAPTTNTVISPANHAPATPPVAVATQPVIVATTSPATNHVAVPPPVVLPTNPTPVKMTFATAAPATNSAAATATSGPDRPARILIYVGVGLLVAALALLAVLLGLNRRRPHSSLITSSMQDGPRRK
ncbi:MAG TPA: hypothetical protein VGI63_07215, partial [Verrucomicrobiae bacterium]